ncbi:MAG: hypothetical protein Q3997_04710 [Propionibacteriaceae bacterium]|nr:hypothetical protein [Propionibacteriaceae bacterium]
MMRMDGIVERAREFGAQASQAAEEAAATVREFTGDAVDAVKSAAAETAHTVKEFAGDIVSGVKDFVEGTKADPGE